MTSGYDSMSAHSLLSTLKSSAFLWSREPIAIMTSEINISLFESSTHHYWSLFASIYERCGSRWFRWNYPLAMIQLDTSSHFFHQSKGKFDHPPRWCKRRTHDWKPIHRLVQGDSWSPSKFGSSCSCHQRCKVDCSKLLNSYEKLRRHCRSRSKSRGQHHRQRW